MKLSTLMYPAATAPDEGLGSLRFFWSNMNPPTATNDPGHVGIVGPLSGNFFAGYSATRIDNNGLPADGQGFNGPTWRTLDEGDYLFDDPQRRPVSKTLPAKRGNFPNGDPKSLLQELDEE